MRFGVAVLSLFVLCGVPRAKTASNHGIKDRVQALAREAFKTRETGDFNRAIRLYRRAFELSPVPELLYNIGFIYEADLRDFSSAQDLYNQCVELPDVDRALKEKAVKRLDAIKVKIMAGEKLSPPQPSPLVFEGRHGSNESETYGAPAWLIASGALGVTAGLTVGAVALHTAHRADQTTQLDDKKKTQSLAKSQALAADIVLSTSAAIAIGGLIWFLLDGDEAESTLRPTMGFGRTGIDWRTRF
ncbi:MAG: hypothetical protein CMH52_04800 [Myxococcales bacterium]|nr:hypothetical protein [Myxococcales bacterium]